MRVNFLLMLFSVPPLALAAEPGDPACLAVPVDVQKKAEQLIKDFDDPDERVRTEAFERIQKMGRRAYPALAAAAARGPSKLAKAKVTQALAEAVPLEFEEQAEMFLEDKKGKFKHDMLGWNTLVAIAGDSPESRKMFAAVLGTPARRELLLEAHKPHTAADERDADQAKHRLTLLWIKEVRDWKRATREGRLSGEHTLTFWVTGMLADVVYAKPYNNFLYGSFEDVLLFDDGREAVRGEGKYGTAFNKLMDAWADSRVGVDIGTAGALYRSTGERPERYSACMVRLVDEYRKKEWSTGRHFWELAKIGDAECVACLRRCLDSKAVLSKRDGLYIEDRDMALGYLVELTGQQPGEYGLTSDGTANFKYAFRSDRTHTADEKRTAAFKKWAEWEKANPDKLKAGVKSK